MTIAQYIAKLDAKLAKLRQGHWVELAAIDTHDAMSQRIFVDNQNVSGKTFKYKPYTVKKKKDKGHRYDRVTFKDTNDLQLDFNNNKKVTKENAFVYKINLKRDRNVQVSKSLDKRYSFVFKIKKSEIAIFRQSAETNFKLIMAS